MTSYCILFLFCVALDYMAYNRYANGILIDFAQNSDVFLTHIFFCHKFFLNLIQFIEFFYQKKKFCELKYVLSLHLKSEITFALKKKKKKNESKHLEILKLIFVVATFGNYSIYHMLERRVKAHSYLFIFILMSEPLIESHVRKRD